MVPQAQTLRILGKNQSFALVNEIIFKISGGRAAASLAPLSYATDLAEAGTNLVVINKLL